MMNSANAARNTVNHTQNNNITPLPTAVSPSGNAVYASLQEIPVSEIYMARYQKPCDENRCRRIANNFNGHRMRPIDLSYRDGHYWCFDGQHRSRVYALLGIRTIPAIVHEGLTYEDEAWLFAHQQDDVGSVNANHKWVAMVEAKDEDALEISRICKEYGFTILEKNNKGNNIKCVSRLCRFYKELGPTKLMAVLIALRDAWEYMPHSIDAPIFDGITLLVKTYPEFDYKRLSVSLGRTTPKILLREMNDIPASLRTSIRGEGRRAAYQILKLYNHKLGSKARLNAERMIQPNGRA